MKFLNNLKRNKMNKLEEEFKDSIYLNDSKDDGKYVLSLSQLDQVGKEAKQITTDVAIKFLEWCNEPVYRASGELGFRSRVNAQFPDYKEYIIIDQTGYSILPKGKFLTSEELFEYFINNHYGK